MQHNLCSPLVVPMCPPRAHRTTNRAPEKRIPRFQMGFCEGLASKKFRLLVRSFVGALFKFDVAPTSAICGMVGPIIRLLTADMLCHVSTFISRSGVRLVAKRHQFKSRYCQNPLILRVSRASQFFGGVPVLIGNAAVYAAG